MKYVREIQINLPLEDVTALFNNPENLAKWHPGLVSMEHISGTPGEKGAKSQLLYQMGKRSIEMVETIRENNLPIEFSASYEAKGVFNIVRNHFEKIDSDKTKWISENEFQFQGFMKLMGWLMPSAFPKETEKYMKQFKTFAESEQIATH